MKTILMVVYLMFGIQILAESAPDPSKDFRKIHTGVINVYTKREYYSIGNANGRGVDNHMKMKYYIQKGSEGKLKLLNRRNLLGMIKNENSTYSERDIECMKDLKKVKRKFNVAKVLISSAAVAGMSSYLILSPTVGSKSRTSFGNKTSGQIIAVATAGLGLGAMITSYVYYYRAHKDVIEIISIAL